MFAKNPRRVAISAHRLSGIAGAIACLLSAVSSGAQTSAYQQTNLVSDGTVTAQHTDPALINPWGIAIGQQTPFWVNQPGSGASAVYDAGGNKQFAVTVPAKAGSTQHGTPTGIAFNPSGSTFMLHGSTAATFLFATLDGTISGWNASTPSAVVAVDNSSAGAVYTGLTLATGSAGPLLLAANFAKARLDGFDSQFAPLTLTGKYIDPTLPQGFAPYGVHAIGNKVYVAYAQQNPAGGPPITGAGLGYVSVFDANGGFLSRVASGGTLNAPWAVVAAPAGFGQFGGDLLVGNFGDGTISAFDPTSFAAKGQLQDSAGKVIVNPGLWDLIFGQQGTGDPNTLYFSAGINDEKGGLFGSIQLVLGGPDQPDFAVAPAAPSLAIKAGQSGSVVVDLSAKSAFQGAVNLSCSGLPAGATCSFSPASVALSANTGTSTMTIATGGAGNPGGGPSPYSARNNSSQLPRWPLAAVTLFPFAAFFRRRLAGALAAAVLAAGLLALGLTGCGSSKSPMTAGPGTGPQPGNYAVTVTATSGAITHTTSVALTVN